VFTCRRSLSAHARQTVTSARRGQTGDGTVVGRCQKLGLHCYVMMSPALSWLRISG